MKKLFSLLLLLCLVIFLSCSKDTNKPPVPVQTIDKSVFFSITYNGKTVTQYGSKSTDPSYNAFIKSFFSAEVKTDVNLNQSNIYIVAHGLNSDESLFSANIRINKVGGNLGIYNNIINDSNIYGLDSPMLGYYIDKANFTITITNMDDQYVTGTYAFNLIIDNKLAPATGSFKLNKL